jgi:transposase-like protein
VPDRAAAEKAMTAFAGKYGAKYAKAVDCPAKHLETLLAFFDFPAEQLNPHWPA